MESNYGPIDNGGHGASCAYCHGRAVFEECVGKSPIFRKASMGLEKYCGQYILHLKACPVTVAGAVHRPCIAVRWPWSGVQKQHLTAMFRAFDRKHKSMYNWRFSRFRPHLRRAGERKFLQFFR